MATKPQAKAVIDTAVTNIKTDIDNTTSPTANIIDGKIFFAPTRWDLHLSEVTLAAAQAQRDFILNALAIQGRAATVVQVLGRRGEDGLRSIDIRTLLATYTITGF